VTRKVNNDPCITIKKTWFDAPIQFIGATVEIRYYPAPMKKAYIYYDEKHFPLALTDKYSNSKTKHNNPYPRIDYSRKEKAND